MFKVEEIKKLRELTGCSLIACKKALEYEETHIDCTAVGYLKAISLALCTRNMSFEERVKLFSK